MTVLVMSSSVLVEHVTIISAEAFPEVRRKLEAALPTLDQLIVQDLGEDDEKRVEAYEHTGPKLSIFLDRDHGAMLQIFDGDRQAIQYEIGNPLTAAQMTRNRLEAALYAPLRIVLFENEDGLTVIEYDKPSSLFGQFGDESIAEIGRYLDTALASALNQAVC